MSAVSVEDRPGADEEPPKGFVLYQNYPNPFNPTTTIGYELSAPAFVELTVFDYLGRKIIDLESGQVPAGRHTAAWDAGDHASGLYFYRIQADDFTATRGMFLAK
jgi:hypothetical protein